MSAILILTIFPDQESAEKVAEKLVDRELIACANIIRIENSIYRWKGKTEKHSEYLMLAKTKMKAYAQTELFIKQNHPAEVP